MRGTERRILFGDVLEYAGRFFQDRRECGVVDKL